jgi:hypothetical protein
MLLIRGDPGIRTFAYTLWKIFTRVLGHALIAES